MSRSAKDDKEVVDQESCNMEHCIEKCCQYMMRVEKNKGFSFFTDGQGGSKGIEGVHRNRASQEQKTRNFQEEQKKEPKEKGSNGVRGRCLFVFFFVCCFQSAGLES